MNLPLAFCSGLPQLFKPSPAKSEGLEESRPRMKRSPPLAHYPSDEAKAPPLPLAVPG
jgi:hypothetical protein